VPGKCTRELLRLLDIEADEKEPSLVEVSVSKSHIQLTLGENTVLSRLVEGDYPDFKKIIPDILPLTNIGRVDLLRAVERIALVGDGVILEFQKQSLHLRSTRVVTDQADFFGEASDALLCASSKEATLTLSCNHLIEALNASQADQIDFFIKDRIAMIKSKDENWTAIISGMAVKKEEK
jgi:DNA polymerase-3 subunit beta